MEQYKEIRSGQILTPANEFLRKLYERQPNRYEKLQNDMPAAKPKPKKESAHTPEPEGAPESDFVNLGLPSEPIEPENNTYFPPPPPRRGRRPKGE